MYSDEEILDLVDENDQVIGQLERSKIYAEGINNFRTINCFIINKHGQLWIPRRAAHKRILPLCLCASAGGHVASGETYDQTFARELAEELNVDVTKTAYKKLGILCPHVHGVYAFMHVYLIESDEVPRYNPHDFVEYFWLYPHEIIKRAQTTDKGHVGNDLLMLIKHFFIDQNSF